MAYWYAIQCASGKEELVRSKIGRAFSQYTTFFPRRELEIRKNGKMTRQITPLFKGYFFISSGTQLIYREAADLVKRINDVSATALLYKVVGMWNAENAGGSDCVEPVKKDEMESLLELTQGGEVVSFSSYKKAGDIVKIISGPLKGMEGILVKANPRKKRIKVALTLMGERQLVDVGASMIQ